ncbi:NTE family protein [Sinorhizobium medicae]|uniref:patatin-like phospholipase family protein n=1 Tax=Sinorhizobium medicae TaxID=110321 RepID=UPI001198FD91|nr:patatin-like phospholipase family protein [Sinorhizobium medicae]MDX0439447.1 patatin-like phospholipase family protein [Sinorhizobium medicae]MDX0913455.1 patatin-like phospholipase family protein [Sinorhizobium medicae]MDX1091166.1 patatin-like phospholipase family protein [Sinorhizobium medicae]MDX1116147.1 patatin-like phospholipase family protein [Sinorhizobium medicae]MQU75211.1 patatin-like phospholipase family protein [Sinorhizobium medicae]
MVLNDDDVDGPDPEGIALCLSGGGYRAMVFHVGAIIRLNEIGLLPKLARVSSVSGGSITAAYLGLRWKDLDFDDAGCARNLSIVIDNIREMAGTSVDAGAIFGGIFLPGTISDRVAKAYDEVLFGSKTTDDLPTDSEAPRFVINATNVQSGALWRFSRPYMGDYRVGLVRDPGAKLSVAVAASSAFPPILSPLSLTVPRSTTWFNGTDLALPEYRQKVVLSDGGVYDNLGLETAFKRCRTLLVSDGGQKIAAEETPAEDWARHSVRILDVVDNQVRSLRKRSLIDSYRRGAHDGCYWGIRSSFKDYGLTPDPLGCADLDPTPIAATPTRLEAMPEVTQKRLINWGYAIADTALRRHCRDTLRQSYGIEVGVPVRFPYPGKY